MINIGSEKASLPRTRECNLIDFCGHFFWLSNKIGLNGCYNVTKCTVLRLLFTLYHIYPHLEIFSEI